jgi:WD40 repeat protein
LAVFICGILVKLLAKLIYILTANCSHERDVNVISWNRNEPLLASGDGDGMLHIWDLRQLQVGFILVRFFC